MLGAKLSIDYLERQESDCEPRKAAPTISDLYGNLRKRHQMISVPSEQIPCKVLTRKKANGMKYTSCSSRPAKFRSKCKGWWKSCRKWSKVTPPIGPNGDGAIT